MEVLCRWSVAKYVSDPHLNEDAIACSYRRNIYAVSDGASESFASRRWARTIVSRYLKKPTPNEDWVSRSIAAYNKVFDREAMSWSAQAAFDRGSFATLLGITLDLDNKQASVLAIGDSLAVLSDGDDLEASYPYEHPEQFQANPLLISTRMDRNIDLFAELDTDCLVRWNYAKLERPTLLCMTDALGAWLLSDTTTRIGLLRRLQTREEFVRLVEAARGDGTMRRDDTSLLIIG